MVLTPHEIEEEFERFAGDRGRRARVASASCRAGAESGRREPHGPVGFGSEGQERDAGLCPDDPVLRLRQSSGDPFEGSPPDILVVDEEFGRVHRRSDARKRARRPFRRGGDEAEQLSEGHRGVVVLLRLPPVAEGRHEDAQGGSRVALTDDQVSGEVPGRPPLAQGRGVLTRTAGGVDESQAFGTGQIVLHARQSPILGLDSPGRPGRDEVGYAGQRPEIGEFVASRGAIGDDDDGFARLGRCADEALLHKYCPSQYILNSSRK